MTHNWKIGLTVGAVAIVGVGIWWYRDSEKTRKRVEGQLSSVPGVTISDITTGQPVLIPAEHNVGTGSQARIEDVHYHPRYDTERHGIVDFIRIRGMSTEDWQEGEHNTDDVNSSLRGHT